MKNLFTKASLQRHKEEKSIVREVTQAQLEENSPGVTEDLWANDPIGTGLKSTQQIEVDWSDWSQHVFFNSAEAKTNLAFEQIINGYPFDGTSSEKTKFLSDLGGYQKWVFDQFDTNKGYFTFDGDVYLQVKDQTGFAAPDLARRFGDAKASESFHTNGSTHEFWMYIETPTDINGAPTPDTNTRIIYQKVDPDDLSKSVSIWSQGIDIETYQVSFHISSDEFKSIKHTITPLSYNRWYHVAFVYERATSERIFGYVDGTYHSHSSNKQAELDDILMGNADIFIGWGSDPFQTFAEDGVSVQKWIGLLDELRVWNGTRTQSQIANYMHRNIDAQMDLQLYHRFSEPSARPANGGYAYQASELVLDYSGNALHTFIITPTPSSGHDPKAVFNGIPTPLENEKDSDNPVLFPDWEPNATLNTNLLSTANQYDRNNPNLITKLVPPHYFQEAQFFEGVEKNLNTPEGMGFKDITRPIPGHGLMPTKLIMMSFLYVWANFFDDIKLFIDGFSNLQKVTYDNYNQIPPQLILFLADYYGISLPNPYANENPTRFRDGTNLTNEKGESVPLSKTLDLMWRRILINLPFLLRSRGTLTGIKALMNTLGIEADSVFRFKEFGGSISKSISASRKKKRKQSGFLNMEKITHIESSPLWAYRHAPGLPDVNGGPEAGEIVFQSGDITITKPGTGPVVSTFTSGSWCWEGRYVIPPSEETSSLFRIERPDPSNPTDTDVLVNLVSKRTTTPTGVDYSIKLFLDGHKASSEPVEVEIPDVNVWDNNPWYISINNEWGDTENTLSLRCIKTSGDFIVEHYSSSINYTKEAAAANGDILHENLPLFEVDTVTTSYQDGLKWAIGLDSSKSYGSTWNPAADAAPVDFGGTVSHMRFWTKNLTRDEQIEHAHNPYSVSVANPINSFAFPNKPIIELVGAEYVTTPLGKYSQLYDGTLPAGSWQRLRQSFDMMQPITSFTAGELELIDTTQNNDHATVYGEDGGYMIDDFIFTIVSPDFDSNSTNNKIRIRSFQDRETAKDNFAHHGVLNELPFETGIDDRRFSIEASLVHALNEDIINLVGNASILNQFLGSPEMEYAVEYPEVKKLMDLYFQRLTGKVNYNAIIEFQRWFNNNFAELVEQFIPHTADFLGINFVIESHMLERHKMEYKQGDVHVDIFDRQAFSQEPLFLGTIRSEIT